MIFAKQNGVFSAGVFSAGLFLLGCLALVACNQEAQVKVDFGRDAMAAMQNIETLNGDLARGDDRWQVVVCRVPQDTSDPIYEPVVDRLGIDAAELVVKLGPVADYFERWSSGDYSPTFVELGEVSISAQETSNDCVEKALNASSVDAQGVLVVADAQHTATSVGGWGRPGTPCSSDCSAKQTRRVVYLGASDFMPYWRDRPPLDLVEHEIGHALDWPHSSTSTANFGDGVYDSEVDVMSDSAASRDIFENSRDAPGPLALNMYLSGWFEESQATFVDHATRTFELVATNSRSAVEGTRLAIIGESATVLWTVELIEAMGDNKHLLHDRVVVHRIELVGISGFERRQTVVADDLLAGDSWSGESVTLTVEQISKTDGGTSAEILVENFGSTTDS